MFSNDNITCGNQSQGAASQTVSLLSATVTSQSEMTLRVWVPRTWSSGSEYIGKESFLRHCCLAAQWSHDLQQGQGLQIATPHNLLNFIVVKFIKQAYKWR